MWAMSTCHVRQLLSVLAACGREVNGKGNVWRVFDTGKTVLSLQGKELEFYLRKMQKKKSKAAA